MELEKYYSLYSDENQTKLLSMAASLEKVKAETEFYKSGVWFEYDQKPGSNFLFNEKIMKSIVFPENPKERSYGDPSTIKKATFKWVA